MGSWRRSGVLVTALAWCAAGSSQAWAQEAAEAGDVARGAVLAYTCLGCHGIPDYKNAYPNYHVPKLVGQHPEYIVAALQAYKSGERSHATMHLQASSLSEQDMRDLAVFFAGEPLEPRPDAAAGEVPEAAQTCVACHGTDGIGITSLYPTLAGQHADYLTRAMIDYKKGGRRNPIMAGFAAQLTEEQILVIAEYYSRQVPQLETADTMPDLDVTASR